MTPYQRSIYFGQLWPDACQAKGWRRDDEVRRRDTTGECMALIGGPATESTTALGQDEITALFCYLDHLGHPACLIRSARWVDCQTDYHAYNRARQADWHESKAYGGGRGEKLRKNRFGGARSAQGDPLDKFNPDAIQKRYLTMRNRHGRKGYRPKQAAGSLQFVTVVNGQRLVGGIDHASGPDQTVVQVREPDPF